MLFTFTAIAQDSGAVSGVVVSTWDGTPLAGATVTVRGTTLAAQTGGDGRFQLNGVPVGEQVLRFSKSGFAAAAVTEVRVLPGQTTTVNGNLRPEFHEMDEFEVTAEEFTQQTEEILEGRKDSSSLMEAIGSEQFSKQNLGDAAEALGKVSGASVADGKFAVIRGLADRYTSTTINGTDLPSADPDRRAAQLDLIPSQFINRMDVYKTFTPDLPGGFVGGAIDIVTRKFPDDFLFSASAGVSYNTQASLRDDFLTSDNSSTDWRATDDGKRAITSPFSSQIAAVAGDSPINQSYGMTLGDSYTVFGRRVGYMAGINYKSDFQQYQNGLSAKYDGAFARSSAKDDDKSVAEYTWSAMGSLGIELLEGHEVGFNYMRVQTAEDEARDLVGYDTSALPAGSDEEPIPILHQSILHWTERALDYSQLHGKHVFAELRNVQVDWAGMLATTSQDEPDHRLFQYGDNQKGTYSANVQSLPSKPLRMWRTIDEESSGIRANLTVPLPSYNTKENNFKTGFWTSQSERDFDSNILQINTDPAHPFNTSGDPASFLAASNSAFYSYGPFGSGNWVYQGEQEINAYYFMGDWAATEWMRLIGGLRFEDTYLKVVAQDRNRPDLPPDAPSPIDQADLLPGVGVTFSLRENLQLRLAYSQTVARPAYRELGKASIFDIADNKSYQGNPNLQMASAQNLDARLEWYPRPGEIVSLSVYQKTIEQPIEAVYIDPNIVSYENSLEADVQGIEAEWVTGLGFLSAHLEDFSFGLNASYIVSEVPLSPTDRSIRGELWKDTATTRPLYDQPEYTFNGELTWDCKASGTLVNISAGIVGRRLVVGGRFRPDEYEEPAPQLNVMVAQKLGKHWKLKFGAKNLLNPDYETTQTWPRYYEPGIVDIPERTVVLKRYTKGITLGLSLSCEF